LSISASTNMTQEVIRHRRRFQSSTECRQRFARKRTEPAD
jgi:hypothetical protein